MIAYREKFVSLKVKTYLTLLDGYGDILYKTINLNIIMVPEGITKVFKVYPE